MCKQVFFRLSPELVDGSSWEITDDVETVIGRVREWLIEMRDYSGGDSFTLETVALTKAEFDAMPEL